MSMIYLDHAATTPVRPEVLEEMLPYLKEMYGNPSGLCQRSMEAAKAVETARRGWQTALAVSRRRFILHREGRRPITGR